MQCKVRWFTRDTCVRFAAPLPECDCAAGLSLVLSELPEAPPQAVEKCMSDHIELCYNTLFMYGQN